VAAVSILIVAINALTVLDDNPELDWWEPWVWEGSSALVIIAILWIPWAAYRRARPGQFASWRFWAIHAAGLLAYGLFHVAGFLVLREAIYAVQGQDYRFGTFWGEFPYELRKDALSYAVFQSVFWITERVDGERAKEKPAPATFDILDGPRVIRVPLDRIVAITSAGNYVEFWLDDGRKPLMRAALTSVEGDLGEKGFVRTHRSWLVNTARVTGLKPEGSGDWAVELGEVEAPLSRRFPEALKRLKGEA
jgi:DNA-binding LytR/AlgR family response regulator